MSHPLLDMNWCQISFWCFDPSIALSQILEMGVRNLILTSGTLSPLSSFESEVFNLATQITMFPGNLSTLSLPFSHLSLISLSLSLSLLLSIFPALVALSQSADEFTRHFAFSTPRRCGTTRAKRQSLPLLLASFCFSHSFQPITHHSFTFNTNLSSDLWIVIFVTYFFFPSQVVSWIAPSAIAPIM